MWIHACILILPPSHLHSEDANLPGRDRPIAGFVSPFVSLLLSVHEVQYIAGAISAPDLVRSLERDVANKIPGCDLEDVVAAALEAMPDKRKRDLLSKAR